MHIWDATLVNGFTFSPRDHRIGVYAIAVSPDGAWLAAAGLATAVPLWDIPGGERRAVFTGHRGPVYAAVASPDSSWLATGGWDGTVRVWDIATARQRSILTGHRGTVYTVAVAPDGRWLASGGSDGTLRIWDTTRWQVQTLMRVDGPVFTSSWLGTSAIACGGKAGLYVFDLLDGVHGAIESAHGVSANSAHGPETTANKRYQPDK
jgi:WD40 repeat protein